MRCRDVGYWLNPVSFRKICLWTTAIFAMKLMTCCLKVWHSFQTSTPHLHTVILKHVRTLQSSQQRFRYTLGEVNFGKKAGNEISWALFGDNFLSNKQFSFKVRFYWISPHMASMNRMKRIKTDMEEQLIMVNLRVPNTSPHCQKRFLPCRSWDTGFWREKPTPPPPPRG